MPWLLMVAILGFGIVAVTHVVYEAEGWGVGELVARDGCVVWHELPGPRLPGRRLPEWRPDETPPSRATSQEPSQTPTRPGYGEVVSRNPSRPGNGFAAEVVRLVQRFLAGEEGAAALATVPVDLEYETPFLGRCATALRAIPPGELVTYGELAALAGAPGAARAAGSFCARNRLGLFVPCHRVVSAGGLGSYGSLGLDYKRRLLELEGAL
jgi:methylated-DNA-[protein]-cysteine S-methyltransferase